MEELEWRNWVEELEWRNWVEELEWRNWVEELGGGTGVEELLISAVYLLVGPGQKSANQLPLSADCLC